MKNLKYYLFSLVLAGTVTSCESLLDEKPLYTQNSSVIFASESNAKMALLGCYGYMSYTDAYGQMWQEVPLSASGFGWYQRVGDDGDSNTSLSATVNNGLISSAWKGMYKVISEANAYLESLEKSSLSDEIKLQYSGEAKFLRGLAYYNLVTNFGDVPLKTVASSSDGISSTRTPAAEVLNQVVADMKDATKISDKSEDGYANSWAAKAFLGKVYYKMARLGINATENFQNAQKMFDDVYANAGYSLEPKFGNLFVDNVKNSKESIFQINFTTESTVCFNRASNRFAPSTSTTGISWGTYKASKLAYDLMEGTYPEDPRLALTFLTSTRTRGGNNQANPKAQVGDELCANDSVWAYPYFTYTIPGDFVIKNGKATTTLKQHSARIPYAELSNRMNPSKSELENYVNTHGDTPENQKISKLVSDEFAKEGKQTNWPCFAKIYDQNQVGTRSHKNLIVYRYAEMLLLMADTYNELGNTQKAISLANEVLRRARNSGTKVSVEPKDWSASLSKEEVSEKIYFERIIEFFGEPNMYEMARMNGVNHFKKMLTLHNSHEITAASASRFAATSNKFLDRIYNNGTITDDYVKKNLLLPIPQSEIDANPGITSADNNFGY